MDPYFLAFFFHFYLRLYGLTSLSDAAAESLSKHAELGLDSLPESAAQILRVNTELNCEIVERLRAETEREELEQQLRQAQKLEAIGQLAGGIAHDFNNLLTALSGYAQLSLRHVEQSDPLAGNLQSVLDCSERGAKLVRQLVAFSRSQKLRSKILDINPLLENASSLVGRLISADIELVISTTPGIGSVDAAASQLEQVLMNLVGNARDAMPRGG